MEKRDIRELPDASPMHRRCSAALWPHLSLEPASLMRLCLQHPLRPIPFDERVAEIDFEKRRGRRKTTEGRPERLGSEGRPGRPERPKGELRPPPFSPSSSSSSSSSSSPLLLLILLPACRLPRSLFVFPRGLPLSVSKGVHVFRRACMPMAFNKPFKQNAINVNRLLMGLRRPGPAAFPFMVATITQSSHLVLRTDSEVLQLTNNFALRVHHVGIAAANLASILIIAFPIYAHPLLRCCRDSGSRRWWGRRRRNCVGVGMLVELLYIFFIRLNSSMSKSYSSSGSSSASGGLAPFWFSACISSTSESSASFGSAMSDM